MRQRPEPDPAKVAGVVYIAKRGDACVPEVIARKDSRPTGAKYRDIEIFIDRVAGNDRIVRIVRVAIPVVVLFGVDAGRTHILVGPRPHDALVALIKVFFPQRGDIDQLGAGNVAMLASH
jgi:hypothetical protein